MKTSKKGPFDDPFFTDPDWFDKEFKKAIIIKVILVAIVLALVFFFFRGLKKSSEKSDLETKHHKEMIGKKVVLEKDTLTIIDFSKWNETYTLSNGVKIDFEVANNNLIK